MKTVPYNLLLESTGAAIPVAKYVPRPRGAGNLELGISDLDVDTKVALIDGLANPGADRSRVFPDCTTGNCSFQSYSGVTHTSVGLCKRCIDITSLVSESPRNTTTPLIREDGTFFFPSNDIYVSDPGTVGETSPNTVLRISEAGPTKPRSWLPAIFDSDLMAAFDDSFKTVFNASVFNLTAIALTSDGCEMTLE